MLQKDTVLAGRYEILGQIGSGGMAYVYKARDKKLGRMVAIKVLKEEFCKNQDFVRKFRGEAQAAAGLSHNNIVGVYDVGDDESIHYIVMELVDGITLKDYITRKKKLGIKESIGIAIQVAQGLETAHNHHIVHRDIKPQNIIISRDARIKVTDFGIARAITDETTNLYGAAGSVHYISPEQARGGYCDERSDIYSLGISMYEMVTGKVPFDGDTTVAVAIAHINDEMTPPSEIEPSVPAALEDIIFKCTSKKPEQRYATCAELIKDLRYALVAPNERFVHFITENETIGSETVVMNSEQVQSIRNQAGREDKKEAPQEGESQIRRQTVELHPVSQESEGKEFSRDYKPEEKTHAGDDETRSVQEKDRQERNRQGKNRQGRNRQGKNRRPADQRQQKARQEEQQHHADRPEENAPTNVDRALAGIGAAFGVIILGMLVYLVGSLNGFFRSGSRLTPAARNTVQQTTAAPETTAAPVETTAADKESAAETVTAEPTTPEILTEVPSVLGLSYNEAKIKIEECGLRINLGRDMEYSDVYPVGQICRQDLDPGNMVSPNTQVTVFVSVGSDKFEVNANTYINAPLENLQYHLKRFTGINVEYYSQHSDTSPKNTVLWLEPSEGYVGEGDTLKVYVSLGPEYIYIPSLINVPLDQAKATLTASNLTVGSVREVYSNTVGAGLVCAQGYAPNTAVKAGSAVNLEVSLGAAKTEVPWVINSNANDYALAAITQKNLQYQVEWVASDQPAYTVINQAPEGGTWVDENSTVVLYVSTGPDEVHLAADAFNNMTVEQANAILYSMNLYYEGPYEEPSATVPPGTVIRWEPSSGDWNLKKGNTVKLFISSGPGGEQAPAGQ